MGYFVFGVAHLDSVLSSELSDHSHGSRDDVVDTKGRDRSEETGSINSSRVPEVLLTNPQLVSLVHNEVSLEGHIKGNEDTEVSKQADVAELSSSDPLENSGVLVDDLTLLEVETFGWVLGGHLDEGLVKEVRVIQILL